MGNMERNRVEISKNESDRANFDLRVIRADGAVAGPSPLAAALSRPTTSPAQRNFIVQELVKDERNFGRFYGYDTAPFPDKYLLEDQRVIAKAVDQAFRDGAINSRDLMNIADMNHAGNGAQRFMSVLRRGGSEDGGAVEALSAELWMRNGNQGMDRAVAAIGFSSNPTIAAQNLNTPLMRRQAFEALVDFNERAPYQNNGPDATRKEWREEALVASVRVFNTHSRELIDHYTGPGGKSAESEQLARFIGQTALNPDAKRIPFQHGQALGAAVVDAFNDSSQHFLDQAAKAVPDSKQQNDYIRQFGNLSASISGGTAYAMRDYSAKIMANEQSRQEFVGIVSGLGNLTPLNRIPGSGSVTEALAGKIFDSGHKSATRPEQAAAGIIFDRHSNQVNELESRLGQTGLLAKFEAAYSSEVLQIQQNTNLNLGGHRQASISGVLSPTVSVASNEDLFERLYASVKSQDPDAYQRVMTTVADTDASIEFNKQVVTSVDATERKLALVELAEQSQAQESVENRSGPRMA